jgi:CelD/BcsL family acetyltransferase involved in cellulose biosynthesis
LLRSLPPLDGKKNGQSAGRSLNAILINPLVDREWDDAISTHPDATIFHSTAWARVLVDTYGHRPCYVQMSLNGSVLALVPMMEVQSALTRSRGICLPFSDYCPPLSFSTFGQELVAQKLEQIARERRWSYLELRSHSIVPINTPASESYYGHSLDLRIGPQALISNFSSSAQRAVRKAQRSGLSVSIQSGPNAMAQFYKLHVRTRRRHGVPPQPRSFFINIQRHLISAGFGFIVLVECQKGPIAAAMFFKLGRHVVYKFGASDERLQELRPNNLAMFEGIRHLAEGGAETLHFGRTETENQGLRRFKLSWGATEETIDYARFDTASASWKRSCDRRSTFHKRIFRALPASLNRLAGAMIYPHLD